MSKVMVFMSNFGLLCNYHSPNMVISLNSSFRGDVASRTESQKFNFSNFKSVVSERCRIN